MVLISKLFQLPQGILQYDSEIFELSNTLAGWKQNLSKEIFLTERSPTGLKNLFTAVLCGTALLTFFPISMGSQASASQPDKIIIETFASSKKNKPIPDGWKSSRGDVSMYSLKEEDGKYYMHVETKGGCTSIGKRINFSAEKSPFLSWIWRVENLPEGGKETGKKTNDSAGGLYVIFKGSFMSNNVLKYVWSSTLPPGTVLSSPYNSRTKIIVLEGGPEKTGKWINETVNIKEDYKKCFGSEPPSVDAIGILTDSDNTKSLAAADYSDIQVSNLEPAISALTVQ
jgi:hypothetical protein